MKTKLLKKIRKRYSYLWREDVIQDYRTKNDDGSWNHFRETQLTLIVVNERTKTASTLIDVRRVGYAIEEFLSHTLGEQYKKLRKEREHKKSQRNYRRFKNRQAEIYPKVSIIKEIND